MSGALTGLDYNVLFRLLDNAGLTGQAWDDMYRDIRVLEEAAIAVRAGS